MSDLQEEYPFQCPSCASDISLLVDFTAGRRQSFTIDCEVCCQPIAITLTVDGEEVTEFEAEKES